jgi:hypothetical protein
MLRWTEVPRVLDAAGAAALIGARPSAGEASDCLRGTGVAVRDAQSGVPVVAVTAIPADLLEVLHRRLPTMEVTETLRANTGYRNASRVFGWAHRKPMFKHEACRSTPFMVDEPELAATVLALADFGGAWLEETLPAVARRNRVGVAPVHADWRLTPGPGRQWTSGVINRNSPMPYHRDRNNFPTWSIQACVRSHTGGGLLSIPEYGLHVPCDDGTLFAFWGQRYVHGVTPLLPRPRVAAYRFTAVFYALRGMKDCASAAYEAAEGRLKRTERETRIATVGINGGRFTADPGRRGARSSADAMTARDDGGGW